MIVKHAPINYILPKKKRKEKKSVLFIENTSFPMPEAFFLQKELNYFSLTFLFSLPVKRCTDLWIYLTGRDGITGHSLLSFDLFSLGISPVLFSVSLGSKQDLSCDGSGAECPAPVWPLSKWEPNFGVQLGSFSSLTNASLNLTFVVKNKYEISTSIYTPLFYLSILFRIQVGKRYVFSELPLVRLTDLANKKIACPLGLKYQVNNKQCFSINIEPVFYPAILPLGNAKIFLGPTDPHWQSP